MKYKRKTMNVGRSYYTTDWLPIIFLLLDRQLQPQLATDRYFDFSTIETILPARNRQIKGQQSQDHHGGPGVSCDGTTSLAVG